MEGFNIAVELFGGFLCLILLVSLWLNGDRTDRAIRLFSRMLLVNLCFLASGAAALVCNGTEFARIHQTGSLLTGLMGFGLLLVYSEYLLERMAFPPFPKSIAQRIRVLCLTGMAVTVLNLFTGWMYHIDGSNFYQRGPLFWLIYALPLAVLLMDGAAIVRLRMGFSRDGILRIICVALPMLSLLLSFWFHGLFWLGLGGTTTLLLVFVNVQLQRDRRLKEQDKEMAEKNISIMLSQIQPHFLYNILGSIEWLCETDPPKAQEATDELARFLRGNMDSLLSTRTIPASRELEHIRCYLNL